MTTLIDDPYLEAELLRQRQESGGDRFDEVWDGVYIMAPLANNEHQGIAGDLVFALRSALKGKNARVFPGVNVSDRFPGWEQNYRCPDVAVVLPSSRAIDRGSYFQGGPDFLVEIVSPRDRSRQKFEFYAAVGVRELLIVDRDPWLLELFQLRGDTLVSEGSSTVGSANPLRSQVLPVSFQLMPGDTGARPVIVLSALDGSQSWKV